MSGHERSRLALAFGTLALAALLFAAPAGATRHPDGHPPKQKAGNRNAPSAEQLAPEQLTDPGAVSASNLAKELDSKGQVDPVAGLGIRNPVCDRPGEIRDRETRIACAANGTPESTYPTSNYGFDVFIATGITRPVGSFTAAFVTILNGIWLGMIFVLKLVLSLLGIAFGLNPFGEGGTMGEVSTSLGRIYSQITDPWLSTLVVCGGIWFAYRGLLRRDLAGGVGGTLAAVAMLVCGLWVIHQPRESVGRLADLSNQVALGTISAPQSGGFNRPVGSYAEAMSGAWSRLVEVPFAGLNFSDVRWALGPPPPEAVERADRWFCQDVGALATIAAYQWIGSEEAGEQCAAFARKRYGRPRRVIDLYLRSSPGSPAREALWEYFDKDEGGRYKAKVAAQGGDGALTRLSMLALFAVGLLGSILLLAWLAIRLFTQSAIAFVLLLGAPFALFFPMLGDAGRRAFKTWGLTLLGALIAKVIYAAFLSIVLLGISILGRAEGPGGSATGFLLSSAFTWSVFLKRGELIGLFSVGELEDSSARGLGLGGVLALSAGRKLSRFGAEGSRGFARRGAEWHRDRSRLGAEATRANAGASLQSSARALADHRHREARRTVAGYEAANPSAPAAPTRVAPPGSPVASTGRDAEPAASAPTPSRARYLASKELVDRVERNERRSGRLWSKKDIEGFAREDAELLRSSRDPADHAHRIGLERTRFEELRGPDRERAEREIEKARKRDLSRLNATDPPGRIVGPPPLIGERVRQGVEGGAAERRQHLRRLRREYRAERFPSRRNLSRGR